jgi:RHS repeat-associated protein
METTDYSGMFVYKDGHIDYIQTPEGRLKWDDQDGIFYAEYYIKDHLGNVRSVVTSGPVQDYAVQGTDYYPFGLEIPVYGTSDNQTKYNSKELQTEADLDWYDYGARFYDPVLARWHSVDPLAEKSRRWSPYSYCMNNPIRFIDPDGMKVDWYETPGGEKKYDENIHSAKDMKEKGIEGKYLGKTYKEGDNYYSLFGQVKDLKTMEGKLFEKIDQTFTNYANYIKEYDQNA